MSGISLSQSTLTVARLYGGEGNDTLIGSSGHDYLYGEDGDDTLTGNAGNDAFSGGSGRDTFIDVEPIETADRPEFVDVAVEYVIDVGWKLVGNIVGESPELGQVRVGGDCTLLGEVSIAGWFSFVIAGPDMTSGWVSISYTSHEGLGAETLWVQFGT